MKTKIKLLVVVWYLVFVSPVQAILIEIDGWTVGDSRLTRDTETGLDWLDLTVTEDRSVNNIVIDNFGNLTDLGFRIVALSEVETLFTHAGASVTVDGFLAADNYEAAAELIDLLGCTICRYLNPDPDKPPPPSIQYPWIYGEGALMTPDGGFAWGYAEITFDELGTTVVQNRQNFGPDHHQRGAGVFLVRATPEVDSLLPGIEPIPPPLPPPIPKVEVSEPSTFFLIGSGLLLMGFWKKYKRTVCRRL